MKGMILAAGLGTRLKPFTEEHPKALFPYRGKTLLEHAVDHLRSAGITRIIINVHHFAGQIIDFVHSRENFGISVEFSDETGELLETGGGVLKASLFFNDTDAVVVRNADVISDLDLREMVTFHRNVEALATLAVRDRITSRYFLFDEQLVLQGWENRKTGDRLVVGETSGLLPLAFSGIQVLDPAILTMTKLSGRFSLTTLYLEQARTGRIVGYHDTGKTWMDAGKADDLK